MMNRQPESNGSIVAAMLAAGIGCLVLGLMSCVTEASKTLNNLFNFYDPVGPMGGKTTVAVAAWLVSWGILAGKWRDQYVDFGKSYGVTLILVALGLSGTFPLFFELFKS